MLELLAFLVLVGVLVVFGLTAMGGFRPRDFLSMAVMISVAAFINRFNAPLTVTVSRRPFLGVWFLFLAWFCVLGIMAGAQAAKSPLGYRSAVGWVLAFALAALASALVNGADAVAIVSALHVLSMSLLPLGVAFVLVALLPRDRNGYENLVTTFLLINGIILPGIMILNSVSRGTLQSIMGWQTIWMPSETGLTEASTFLGGRITSGSIAFLAYGLAMTRFVARKQWVALIPVSLCGFATFFSLSRTNLLLMVVFHLIFFWQNLSRHFRRIAAFIAIALLVFTYAAPRLGERYSFERLTQFKGRSVDARTVGIKAAFLASLKSPVLGQGPGLLYEKFRSDWMVGTPRVRPEMVVEGYKVPLEPHNTYAFLAAEHGLVGLATFTAIFVVLWRRTQLRNWQALSKTDQTYRTAYNALWISWLLGLWVHSMPLFEMKPSLMFWLFAASGVLWRSCVVPAAQNGGAALPARGPTGATRGAPFARPRTA